MTFVKEILRSSLFATTLAAATLVASAGAEAQDSSVKLLSAQFEPRQVVQVEAGDFHFVPGQVAPIHTHDAPAIGYVTKGAIIYQVEGEKAQILRAGDAFFEPVDKRILRFDNLSATEEAIFIDFNLEQEGEPFIVFEKELTVSIDRRTLPTTALDGSTLEQADIYSRDLAPSASQAVANSELTFGIVAQGIVEVRVDGQATQRVVAGGTFALPQAGTKATVVNVSSELPAKIITFRIS